MSDSKSQPDPQEASKVFVVAHAIKKAGDALIGRGLSPEMGCIELARAAIVAMREPTEGMLEASQAHIVPDDPSFNLEAELGEKIWRAMMHDCWRAMIDAALEGK